MPRTRIRRRNHEQPSGVNSRGPVCTGGRQVTEPRPGQSQHPRKCLRPPELYPLTRSAEPPRKQIRPQGGAGKGGVAHPAPAKTTRPNPETRQPRPKTAKRPKPSRLDAREHQAPRKPGSLCILQRRSNAVRSAPATRAIRRPVSPKALTNMPITKLRDIDGCSLRHLVNRLKPVFVKIAISAMRLNSRISSSYAARIPGLRGSSPRTGNRIRSVSSRISSRNSAPRASSETASSTGKASANAARPFSLILRQLHRRQDPPVLRNLRIGRADLPSATRRYTAPSKRIAFASEGGSSEFVVAVANHTASDCRRSCNPS